MTTEQIEYRRVRAKGTSERSRIVAELKMISELRKIGKPFRAVSKTEYIISKKQCDTLKRKNVPYEIVPSV